MDEAQHSVACCISMSDGQLYSKMAHDTGDSILS